jgi:hypothetical protein
MPNRKHQLMNDQIPSGDHVDGIEWIDDDDEEEEGRTWKFMKSAA